MDKSKDMLKFYEDYFKNDLISFWNKAIDSVNGGVYTCFTNDGGKLLSKDK